MSSGGPTTRRPRAESSLRRAIVAPFLLILFALAAGCATRVPARIEPPRATGDRIAAHALEEVGRRYQYGGETREGFDCSGLALYVHSQEGFEIPRTAAAQYATGERIARDRLRPGDLVFFRFAGRAVDHVGVYIGDGEFVHAPGAGSTVRRAALDAEWFARRYVGAARWWSDRNVP